LLKEEAYRPKWKWTFWPSSRWARGLIMGLLALLFLGLFGYSLEKGSSRQLVRLLADQSFPFEAILLEGIAGYSEPQRERLDEVRSQAVSLGTFLLTGANISDPRTYFFSYFTPPPEGPAWIGWAYNPGDPEFEGEVPQLEKITPEGLNNGTDPRENQAPVSNEVLVGIYHTHTAESFAGDGGVERNPGGRGQIVNVGDTLKKSLERNGVKGAHSTEIHDADDFYKAYSKSVNTAGKLVKDYPSMKLLIDLHRDGLLPGAHKSTVHIDGKEVSRILIVIGKMNPHWEKNEEIAKELIAYGEKLYPGLFIPKITYAEDARYNQHLSDGALILEIGSQLNTFEEANGTAEVLGKVISEWLKEK
jgi:stage II sporulation protein P